jgi:hypothetical protein
VRPAALRRRHPAHDLQGEFIAVRSRFAALQQGGGWG